MNLKIVLRSLGILLICESLSMLPSLFVSGIYRDGDTISFLITIGIILSIGIPLQFIKKTDKKIKARDGFAIVAFGWILISIFGALPFYLSGTIPSFVDAFFESASGFTTTGASILNQIEGLPHGILFWRSFTHWVGGMGILVLTIALLPSMGSGSMQVMKAESPGPVVGKIVPRLQKSAKILYFIYFAITIAEVILLYFAGMSLFDAFIHALGTVGTGGFSNMNASVAAYDSVAIDVIITIFMIMSGINFSLYYFFIKGNLKTFWQNEEFKLYMGLLLGAIAFITVDLTVRGYYDSLGESLRYSSFQVASVMTTTGYATADFDQWSMITKIILLLLMFVGGCAGSTGGGIKNIRFLIFFKSMKNSFRRIIHPHGVYPVHIDGKLVEEKTVLDVMTYFFIYMVVFAIGVMIVSFDGFDIGSTVTSVLATLSNIGPGIGIVGPTGNYSAFSDISKIALSMLMIIGRIEIYPILLLLVPTFWRRT
ncbi:MAG: TrkH family potassium uptake protein [Turicibacter sp.]